VSRPAPSSILHRYLSARVREGRAPGAAWWVEGPSGEIEHGACGSAALEPFAEPLLEETPFDLASLTKPLCTALLLALLEQERALDLAAPVEDYLGSWRQSPFGSRSLLELATHSAGLPAWRPLYLRERSIDGYLDSIAAERPATPPGTVLYSDLGYIALGAILERVSGSSLDRLFAQHVAAPLGLNGTGFATDGAEFANAAATERGNEYERALAAEEGEGYAWPTEILRGRAHDGNARALGGVAGHAGLFGPLEEVATIPREILRPERLPLRPDARRRLLEPAPSGTGRTVGLVTAAASGAARGILPADAPGHTGFTGTSLWLDPTAGAAFVLLTNRVHPAVPAESFQYLRRGFHRLGAAMVRGL
jgi:CubicO group peptidase (beta-lactamase class C family)